MKETIGCYMIHLQRKINEGRQASIYQGYNSDLMSDCCVRVIDKKQSYDQNSSQSFEKELSVIEQLKWLRHPNLITIYDYKEEKDYIYQFCELCDESLFDYMKTSTNFTKKDFLEIIKQVSDGYLELIKNNIIHRDLKPQNILVKRTENQVYFKISDFGISKLVNEQQRLDTNQVGTQQYFSPEMLAHNQSYNYQSDMFSFGLILYEQVVGQIDLYDNAKKQKEFFDQLQRKDFKQYLKDVNNQITSLMTKDDTIDSFIEILDKILVYDPSKRITWESLNKIAFNQLKEYQSFTKSIHQFRERGAKSLYQNQSLNQNQFQQLLKENVNIQNIQKQQAQNHNFQGYDSQLKIQNFKNQDISNDQKQNFQNIKANGIQFKHQYQTLQGYQKYRQNENQNFQSNQHQINFGKVNFKTEQ